MNKFQVILAAVIVFLTSSAGPSVFAQIEPEQVDVVSLQVQHIRNIDSGATVTYRNSVGSLITFFGFTGQTIPYGSQAFFGSTLISNSFRTNYSVYDTGGGSIDTLFRFTLASIESEPIVLRPTVSRRKRDFTLSGETALRGKLEIIDRRPNPDKVIAVDDDFELTGRYKATFLQSFGSQRTAAFYSLTYDLNATP